MEQLQFLIKKRVVREYLVIILSEDKVSILSYNLYSGNNKLTLYAESLCEHANSHGTCDFMADIFQQAAFCNELNKLAWPTSNVWVFIALALQC